MNSLLQYNIFFYFYVIITQVLYNKLKNIEDFIKIKKLDNHIITNLYYKSIIKYSYV